MREVCQDSDGLLSPFLSAWRLRVLVRHVMPGDAVLDCGCGSGRLVRLLPEGCRYLGVDVVSAFSPAENEDVRFLQADLESEAALRSIASEGPFDAIAMAAVVEHLADPAAVLTRLRPLLPPQGRLLITMPHPAIRRFHEIGARVRVFSRESADDHEEVLGRERMAAICTEAGLDVTVYQRFQLGCNQLYVLRSAASGDV